MKTGKSTYMSVAEAQEKNFGLVQGSHQDGKRWMKSSLKSESKNTYLQERGR